MSCEWVWKQWNELFFINDVFLCQVFGQNELEKILDMLKYRIRHCSPDCIYYFFNSKS